MQTRGKLTLTRFWIVYSTFCSVAGWTLSALHQLNPAGWLIFFAAFVALIAFMPGLNPSGPLRALNWQKLAALGRRRFRRPLPFLFLVIGLLVFARCFANTGTFEGMDVGSYRIPRVLHWIHDQRWTWIATNDPRLNNRGCGFEWMELPSLMIGHSDRLIPLLTAIPFFLLPGVIFAAFRRLQVSARVAWSWCWILPGAYCILLQAGSGFTDGMGVFYVLAAVALALEAGRRADVTCLFCSILAGAFLTNLKASNLPLLLPIFLAMLPALPLLRKHVGLTLLVGVAAFFASFLPNAIANSIYLHDWTGLSVEPGIYKPVQPLVALALNSVVVAAYSFAPPVMPIGSDKLVDIFHPLQNTFVGQTIATGFEGHYGTFPRLITVADVGTGVGVTVLLLPFVIATLLFWMRKPAASATTLLSPSRLALLIVTTAWAGLAFVLIKSTLRAISRLITPYYPFLFIPFLRHPTAERIVRNKWWRVLAFAHLLLCIALLFGTTINPAWPTKPVVQLLEPHLPHSSPIRSALDTYSFAWKYHDFGLALVAQLPPDKEMGLVRGNFEEERMLWLPYGSRLLSHVMPDDTAESLTRRGITHVLVTQEVDPEPVIQRLHAVVEHEFVFTNPRVAEPLHIYLLRIDASP